MTQMLTFPAWRTLFPQMISILESDIVLERKALPFAEIDYDHHRIHVDAFEIMSVPVTQWLYQTVMGENPSVFWGDDHPVESVSYLNAVAFCNRMSEMHGLEPHYETSPGRIVIKEHSCGFRLPSLFEYETVYKRDGFIYGERVDLSTALTFNAELSQHAWYEGNSGGGTRPVGEKGCFHLNDIFDLYGNVSEIVEAMFSLSHFTPDDSKPLFLGNEVISMSQGSSFASSWEEILSNRYHIHSNIIYEGTGFRLAKSINP